MSQPDNGRIRLIKVAMRLFAAHGFDSVTVRQLAAEADVSIGLIKHHFESKEGLREAVDTYFLERSGVAMDNALAAVQGRDADFVAEYEQSWLARYANEWPDFVAYLRRAIIEKSPWGEQLFARYYSANRLMIDRLDATGNIARDIDRVWLPWLFLFLQLGPVILDPYIQSILGKSSYDQEMWGRLQKALHKLFWEGVGAKDEKVSELAQGGKRRRA